MTINSQQREQIRLCILRHLDANAAAGSSFGISLSLLVQYIRNEGFRQLDAVILAGEILYLEDKGMIVKVDKAISPENSNFRIVAHGRDYYAQQQQ